MAIRIREHGKEWGDCIASFAEDAVIEGTGGMWDRAPQHVEARVKRIAEAFGRLIETLHDKGALSRDDIMEVCGYSAHERKRFEFVEEEE